MAYKLKLDQKWKGVARFSSKDENGKSTGLVDLELGEDDEDYQRLEEGKTYSFEIGEEVDEDDEETEAEPRKTRRATTSAKASTEVVDPTAAKTSTGKTAADVKAEASSGPKIMGLEGSQPKTK